MAQQNNYAIETISLTKIFPDFWGRAKVIAVDDLDLQVKHNEIFGLLGPNGSGKTTTMKMLLNLLYPTKGKALVLGGSSGDTKVSSRIGYLPEDSYLYKYLSARETLDFYGRIFGLPRSIRKARIEALLEMVGLEAMANRPVGTYSKGMARRIGLAQALINDPDVLILDEPTSGMDPIGTRQIKDLLVKLAKRGKTILLCSHLLADVEDVCDRIAILYGGRLQVQGSVDSLLENAQQQQITTSVLSNQAMQDIQSIIEKEKADCQISSPMEKLEDYFVRVVADAQQQHQPTSGAVSGTQLSDFLMDKPETKPDMLDELVTAAPEEAETVKPTVETVDIKPAAVEPAHNAQLLDDLTKQPTDDLTIAPTKPAQTKPTDKGKVDQNVLEQLIDRTEKPGSTKPAHDDQSGEDQNA